MNGIKPLGDRWLWSLTDAPPCPHCGRTAEALEGDKLPQGQWTVATFPRLRYTLHPCGHDVYSFDASIAQDPVVVNWTARAPKFPPPRKWRTRSRSGTYLIWLWWGLLLYSILNLLGVL